MKHSSLGFSFITCAGLLFACDATDSGAPLDDLMPGLDALEFPDLVPLDALPMIDSGGEPVPVDASFADTGPEPTVFEDRVVAYDDGRGRYVTPGATPGNAAGVLFTVPAGTVVDEVYFNVSAEVERTFSGRVIRRNEVPFRLRIAAVGEGRAPGQTLFPRDGGSFDVAPKPPEGNGHLHVDLREHALVVPGEFYVIMEWPMDHLRGTQALGFDGSRPDGRTWLRLDGTWRPVEKSPGFGPMDAMIRAEVRAPAGILPPEPVVLGNVARECTLRGAAGPWADEGGLLTAARVTSPVDGFVVEEIRLQVNHEATYGPPFSGTCNAETPFRVELYRGGDGPPDKVPESIETFDVAVRRPDGDPAHQVRLHPMTRIALDKDESLFVAVHMERPDDRHVVCVQTCRAPATVGEDYWSTHAAPPYGWVPFEVLDIAGASNLDVELVGRVATP